MGPPRVGVGLQAFLEPRERRLAVAQIGGHHRAVAVGTREPGRQADALVEEAGRALDVAVAQIPLAGDQEELLGPLGDVAIAAQANADVAGAGLLVGGRAGDARALDDHEPAQAHVALVRQPLAVPPDAVRRVGLSERREPERLEDLLAVTVGGAGQGARLPAVILAGLHDRVGLRHAPGLLEVALFHQDVELDLHDVLERGMLAQELGLESRGGVLEEPAHLLRMQGQQAVELGQGAIVLAHSQCVRRRAVDDPGVVGSHRRDPVVEGFRLVELAHELGDAGARGQRQRRGRRGVRGASGRRQRLGVATGLERGKSAIDVAQGRRGRPALLRDRGERRAERQEERCRESLQGVSHHRVLYGVGPCRASRPNWALR